MATSHRIQRSCAVRLGVPVECFSIANAASQKLRPAGDGNVVWERLWQQVPKLRIVPAKLVTATKFPKTMVKEPFEAKGEEAGRLEEPPRIGGDLIH